MEDREAVAIKASRAVAGLPSIAPHSTASYNEHEAVVVRRSSFQDEIPAVHLSGQNPKHHSPIHLTDGRL